SDDATREYFSLLGRESEWRPLAPDEDAEYDDRIELDLSTLEPLVALPSSPDRVVPVSEVEGEPVEQIMVGSCTNSSWEDMPAVARVLAGRRGGAPGPLAGVPASHCAPAVV